MLGCVADVVLVVVFIVIMLLLFLFFFFFFFFFLSSSLLSCQQKSYSQQLAVRAEGSHSTHIISVCGRGKEPELEFPTGQITLGPVLPDNTAEADIVVSNPMDFPIEFYSLEFDKQYLHEEKVKAFPKLS